MCESSAGTRDQLHPKLLVPFACAEVLSWRSFNAQAQPNGGAMTANWKSRWEKQRLELAATRREVTRLRSALDELNADVEEILNDAALIGHEMAKSHAIRRQMATIRNLRKTPDTHARINEGIAS